MNIALIGYGNMGQEIDQLVAGSSEHTITSISYNKRSDGLDIEGLKKSDVAIDFTSPEIVQNTVDTVLSLNIPLVIGTTGWYEKLPHIEMLVQKNNGSLVYGQNFSIGANIFFQITAYASQLVSQYEGYDVFGMETHHTGKKDSPSGTARKLGEIILNNFPRKKVMQTEKLERQINPDELHFASVRGGRNFGKHDIVFDSPADEIRLTHQAWNREGFAKGALMAAQFIKDKKGIYDFENIFMKGELDK